MSEQLRIELMYLLPPFRAFIVRHGLELDAWETQALAHIRQLTRFHSRAIGQSVRRARVALMVTGPWELKPDDPDYFAILRERMNGVLTREVAALDVESRERFLRLVVDQPFTLKE